MHVVQCIVHTLLSLCYAALAVQGLQLDPSHAVSVQGLAAAEFFTFQQQLQAGQLPWGVQDEWVQHVFAAGDASTAATVFNMAVLTAQHHAAAAAAAAEEEDDHNQVGKRVAPVQVAVPITPADFARPLEWLQSAADFKYGPSMRSTCKSRGLSKARGLVDPGRLAGPLYSHGSEAPVRSEDAARAVYTTVAAVADDATDEAIKAVEALNACKYRNYMLYLGMSIPGGGLVSDQELATFVQEAVAPKLQGFTMWSATGFWQGESEATTILEVIGTDDKLVDDVAAVAAAYKRTFKQEAVLVKQDACPAVTLV